MTLQLDPLDQLKTFYVAEEGFVVVQTLPDLNCFKP